MSVFFLLKYSERMDVVFAIQKQLLALGVKGDGALLKYEVCMPDVWLILTFSFCSASCSSMAAC